MSRRDHGDRQVCHVRGHDAAPPHAVRGAQQPAARRSHRREARHLAGPVLLKTFANGEIYARYEESIRDADVFIVQSPHGKLNQHVVELLIMIQAAKLASAHRVTAVLPYFPYARQDKKSAAREPIAARLMATLLEAAGADRVLSMDLHQGQVQGFFEIPVDHMTAVPMLADYFSYRGLGDCRARRRLGRRRRRQARQALRQPRSTPTSPCSPRCAPRTTSPRPCTSSATSTARSPSWSTT